MFRTEDVGTTPSAELKHSFKVYPISVLGVKKGPRRGGGASVEEEAGKLGDVRSQAPALVSSQYDYRLFLFLVSKKSPAGEAVLVRSRFGKPR